MNDGGSIGVAGQWAWFTGRTSLTTAKSNILTLVSRGGSGSLVMGFVSLGTFLSIGKASKYVLTLVVLAHKSNRELEAHNRESRPSGLAN
jgi:hypothetical protein